MKLKKGAKPMNVTEKDCQVALSIVKKYQNKINNYKSSLTNNKKKLAVYWMCTDICGHTNLLMNDGLDKLFNHLYNNGWINFSCKHNEHLRYHFYFNSDSKFALTNKGKQALQKFTTTSKQVTV